MIVAQAIISIFLKKFIKPDLYTMKPTIIRGRDPYINNFSNFLSLNNLKKSSLK